MLARIQAGWFSSAHSLIHSIWLISNLCSIRVHWAQLSARASLFGHLGARIRMSESGAIHSACILVYVSSYLCENTGKDEKHIHFALIIHFTKHIAHNTSAHSHSSAKKIRSLHAIPHDFIGWMPVVLILSFSFAMVLESSKAKKTSAHELTHTDTLQRIFSLESASRCELKLNSVRTKQHFRRTLEINCHRLFRKFTPNFSIDIVCIFIGRYCTGNIAHHKHSLIVEKAHFRLIDEKGAFRWSDSYYD